MAGHPLSVAIYAVLLANAPASAFRFPNHKYDTNENNTINERENQKGEFKVKKYNQDQLSASSNQAQSQLRSPLAEEESDDDIYSRSLEAERKVSFYKDRQYSRPSKGKRSYENFVTPKGEKSAKRYEVTTEKFEDSESESPVALGLDNDVAIAFDDEEDEDYDKKPETSRPEHLNPLVYLDSYGRLHGEGQSPSGVQGFGYGVVHPRTPPRLLHSRKATDRVRMQVFRGPTRIVGHKRFAPWGFYVVQPAAGYGPYHRPGPPYYR